MRSHPLTFPDGAVSARWLAETYHVPEAAILTAVRQGELAAEWRSTDAGGCWAFDRREAVHFGLAYQLQQGAAA